MTCKSIYGITHDIACNGTGFEWENCVGNQFVISGGVIIDDNWREGEPIAFWTPDKQVRFANNPDQIPAGTQTALSVRRYVVINGEKNPAGIDRPSWEELHTWQLLGQGRNGETIIISIMDECTLHDCAEILIGFGAVWAGDLDSGGSVSTKCGDDIITIEDRPVANFLVIDKKQDGGSMATHEVVNSDGARLWNKYVDGVLKDRAYKIDPGTEVTVIKEFEKAYQLDNGKYVARADLAPLGTQPPPPSGGAYVVLHETDGSERRFDEVV